MNERLSAIELQAREMLRKGGAGSSAVEIERRVDMRYVGQGYEVPVPLPTGALDASVEQQLRSTFDRLYRDRFGTSLESAEVECVHWRLTARVDARQVSVTFPVEPRGEPRKGERAAYFPEVDRYLPCPVLDRYQLAAAQSTPGPVLIEERESTIVIGPSATWRVDDLGNVLVSFASD